MKKKMFFHLMMFAIGSAICGGAIGHYIGKKSVERKIKEASEEKPVKLYPDTDDDELNDFDPEDSEDDITKSDIYEVAKRNGYVAESADDANEEDIESSKRYMGYMESHSNEINIISPDSEKRSDELNEVLDFLDTEVLLYFPDEDVLIKETAKRKTDKLNIPEYAGKCLTKFGFAGDDDQKEIQILNVPKQMHYIIKKELEDTVEELFSD